MTKHLKFISIFVAIFFVFGVMVACSTSSSDDPGDDPPRGDIPDQLDFSDAFEINSRLGTGINLGNALEANFEGEWGMVVQEEYIQLIKDAGFEHVRIPIRWNAYAETQPPFTLSPAIFDRVDEIMGWALDRGLGVMLNIHHFDELMESPAPQRNRFIQIWSQIADHYKDYPEQVVFEVLNEPHNNLTPQLWNNYLDSAVYEIRKTNPRRVLVIGTANWGGFYSLPELVIPENDRQLIVTVHYYNPFQFTHQGATWAGSETVDWIGTTWDETEAEKAEIDSEFDAVVQWAETHNRPIHMGEFGAFSTADNDSRERWTRYVRQAAEDRDFSWAYWEFGAGFGVYNRDTQQWNDYLLRALLPDSPEL